jgi:hypothetical protein
MDTLTIMTRLPPRAAARTLSRACRRRRTSRAPPPAAAAAASSSPSADADSRARAALSQGWPNALALPPTAAHRPPLPNFLTARHYVNLSAGAEALATVLPALAAAGAGAAAEPRFCRVTSTACEQQRLERTLAEVSGDASLMMDLALGERDVIIWDCGSRRRKGRRRQGKGDKAEEEGDDDEAAAAGCCPRALWYGLEFARWALHSLWFEEEDGRPPFLRGFNVERDFRRLLSSASSSSSSRDLAAASAAAAVKRARYFSRFVPAKRSRGAADDPFALRLYGCYAPTERDGDVEYCSGLVAASQQQQQRRAGGGGGGRGEDEGEDEADVEAAESRAREIVLQHGWRVFAGGVGHEEMPTLLR